MENNQNRQLEIVEFLKENCHNYTQFPLAGDASFRRYIRIFCSDKNYMLMDAPPEKENVRPFIEVCRHLLAAGYSAPNIIKADEKSGFLLLEDLGNDSFSRILRVDSSNEEQYYRAAVSVLASFVNIKNSLNLPAYDTALLLSEISLFSRWFLPQIIESDSLADLQAEYEELWRKLLSNAPLEFSCFVHRDYHADNLMWLPHRDANARVGLLDFQDAVYGDPAYDLVSLLEDARRDVSGELASLLIDYYLQITKTDKSRFLLAYSILAAQRNSKIIGIFTRLAVRDGKEHYLQLLPRVWKHLLGDIKHPELAALADFINRYIPTEKRGVISLKELVS